MSFEIQELPDVIRIVILLNLSTGKAVPKLSLKRKLDKVCASLSCIDMPDLEEALTEMEQEGLITREKDAVQLTKQGLRLGKEWKSLLLKKEPILEVVAGLVDGSITGLVVILSSFISLLTGSGALSSPSTVVFAAFLTLTAVAITNFSSFFLGGVTEDLADILTLRNLMNFSLSDIPDKIERKKSLILVKNLFLALDKEIRNANLYAAVIVATTTFVAGSIPIAAFLLLPYPINAVVSLSVVAAISGIFLVRYRSKKTRVHWKVTLLETLAIVGIATLASVILGLV
ncbi:MAG: hypothetical protein NWF04_09460 [Candidatus Bathyarchaeota archaeon]|nr:hypothetical protein [Candidatus Bathyarchaeota archaeon]